MGKAGHVKISLTHIDGHFALSIQDDGTGFQTGNGSSTGMGVRIMQYRARTIGATLDLKSVAGNGTRVTCIFFPTAGQLLEKEAKT